MRVLTALQSKISSEVCSRFKPQVVQFAAILEDGSVVSWGNRNAGGDSSKVQDKLRGVQQIQATGGAFAAILGDGSVVTWGNLTAGGDSSEVQDQLRSGAADSIHRWCICAAILAGGSVLDMGQSKRWC